MLGVDASASIADVRAAYRCHVKRHHPDRGGDADELRRGTEAFAVLSRAPAAPASVMFVRRAPLAARVRARILSRLGRAPVSSAGAPCRRVS
jgi:hypothetical protein